MSKHEENNEKQEQALQTAPAGGALEAYDPGDYAGAGLNNVGMDERKIPFLRILDPKSPQCKPVKAGGIPGANGGAIFNTATNEVFDGDVGFEFLPVEREQKFIEWLRREEDGSGGGFVAVHEPDEPLIKAHRSFYGKFGKMALLSEDELEACVADPEREPVPLLDEDNKVHELVQTFSLYGIALMPNGNTIRAIVSMSSTQIPKYQGIMGRLDDIRYKHPVSGALIKPALWTHRLRLTTQYEERGAQSWYGWVITFAEKNEDGTDNQLKSRISAGRDKDGNYVDQRFGACAEFYELIRSGESRADYSASEGKKADPDALPEE